MRFAELISATGQRIYVGCVMAAGQDWVEISIPERIQLGTNISVRFFPSTDCHPVRESWRSNDRVGLTYVEGGPPDDFFLGLGLYDPRPASLKKQAQN